jgi:hypothetical protein
MTIHLDQIHKRIMGHALSRHTLSILTLGAIAVQKIWRARLPTWLGESFTSQAN